MPPEASPAVSPAEPDPVDEPIPRGWPAGFAEGRANRRAVLVLATVRGIMRRDVIRLAWREGTAEASVAAIRAGRAGTGQDRAIAAGLDVEELERRVSDARARMAVPGDEEYVASIEDVLDPPVAVFVRGGSLARPEPHVAIVGARACTPYGREVARALGLGLGSLGCVVVSGGARGIDTASHEGALAGGGATVAVLGCGIDRAYPASNRGLLARIVERGGTVVSEYPPGAPALPHHFPARNRIVAALSAGVVVVEGAKGSGSVITAELALDIGRTVMAVPGPVNSGLSVAPLQLIRDGAAMVRGVDDVVSDVGIVPLRLARDGGDEPDGTAALPRGLSSTEARVFRALAGPTLAEDVARAADLDLRMAVATLLGLELRGLVLSIGGRYMVRPGVAGS